MKECTYPFRLSLFPAIFSFSFCSRSWRGERWGVLPHTRSLVGGPFSRPAERKGPTNKIARRESERRGERLLLGKFDEEPTTPSSPPPLQPSLASPSAGEGSITPHYVQLGGVGEGRQTLLAGCKRGDPSQFFIALGQKRDTTSLSGSIGNYLLFLPHFDRNKFGSKQERISLGKRYQFFNPSRLVDRENRMNQL